MKKPNKSKGKKVGKNAATGGTDESLKVKQ